MARYSESMSSDTISSMFPDRPIHPLPKRRLRERLSPEAAESIEYPPTPPATVFYYPYNSAKDDDSDAHKGSSRARGAATGDLARGLEREEEDPARVRRSLVPRSAPSILGRPVRTLSKADQARQGHAQAPPSTASSVDGYDTFENTNNKKKRKVPDTALGGHSLNDLSVGSGQMSPSTPSRAVHGESCGTSCGSLHGVGLGSPGISGPGRGRFGRNRSGRSPLSEGSRNSKVRPVRWPLSAPVSNPGIISNAIAKVEKPPSQQGQENVSLLQIQQDQNSSPVSGQFTFTCDTQVPGTVSWPGALAKAPGAATHTASASEHGISKLKPGWAGGAEHRGPSGSSGGSRAVGTAPQAVPQKKTRRRSRVDEYAKAAAERKRSTQVQNLHHPPKEEEMWICHFCEYEYIFGEKPEALIRQYEIKDRKKRKEEEERRRLLEKAKARGRKGKKGAKAPAKNAAAAERGHMHDQQGHEYDGARGNENLQGHDQDYDGQYMTPVQDDDGESQDNKSSDDVIGEFEGDAVSGDGLGEAKPPDTSPGRRFGTRAGRVASTSSGGGPSMVGRPVKV